MNRGRLLHVLRESGLCLDRVRLLDRIRGRAWARVLCFRFLRLRFSPAILEDALAASGDLGEQGRLFSLAVSYLNVGDSYKTTGQDRMPLADAMLLELAGEFDRPVLLEAGASDGSASLAILRHRERFSRILLTDRFPCFYQRRIPLGRVFLDGEGRLLGLKWLCLYLNLALERRPDRNRYRRLESVNPVLAREFEISAIAPFDALTGVLPEPVQLIRCANLLNLSYFTPEQVRSAACNLGRSLIPGGYLMVVQNNARYARGEALFVLRKTDRGFDLVREMNGHEAAGLFQQAERAWP